MIDDAMRSQVVTGSAGAPPLSEVKGPQPFQCEQIPLESLRGIFEAHGSKVEKDGYFEKLRFTVNCNTQYLDIIRCTDIARKKILDPKPTFEFMIRVRDGMGNKTWEVDANGIATPVYAKAAGSTISNPYDMAHLSAATLVSYVAVGETPGS